MRIVTTSSLLCALGVVSATLPCSYASKTIILPTASFSSHRTAAIAAFASTATPSIPTSQVVNARASLATLAIDLKEKSKTGVFLTDPKDRDALKKSVAELEALCGPPTLDYDEKVVGDWTLLSTTVSPSFAQNGGKTKGEKKKLPFGLPDFTQGGSGDLPDPLKNLRNSINKSVEVTQRIRRTKEEGDLIDRVDNVIEYTPFNSLDDLLGDSNPLKDLGLNLNPLEVTKSKVTLAHDAEVESRTPVYRTKIALKSVILNVAGTSQNLDPAGADVLGLNVPLGEFLNAGSFDTTYVDDNIRVSRGTVGGVVDQLRVFIKKGVDPAVAMEAFSDEDEISGSSADLAVEEEVEVEEKEEEVEETDEGETSITADEMIDEDEEKSLSSDEGVDDTVETDTTNEPKDEEETDGTGV
mmetsp:Transcript_18457/g.25399  ORF Transcript_18457/g.25399 Transcript_18457/m.25399 type:complete len:412 (-) Transcript_18457:395-1630(-)